MHFSVGAGGSKIILYRDRRHRQPTAQALKQQNELMEMGVSVHIILLILYLEHRNHLNSFPIRHAVPVLCLCLSKEQRKSNAKSRAERASNLGGISIDATIEEPQSSKFHSNPITLHASALCLVPHHAMQININALPTLIVPLQSC
jgi:hypothetical protein